jgi:hypothetical protein
MQLLKRSVDAAPLNYQGHQNTRANAIVLGAFPLWFRCSWRAIDDPRRPSGVPPSLSSHTPRDRVRDSRSQRTR